MHEHGVRFQPSLSGALHTARTSAFFLGGGKASVNAYQRSAAALDVRIRDDAPADRIELRDGRFGAAFVGNERIEARACVLAAGGFESDRAWLREARGQDGRGEWPADDFLIRGTRYNTGILLRFIIDAGADVVGDPTQAHMVAIDARAPLYDGGICTRIDAVSLGVVVEFAVDVPRAMARVRVRTYAEYAWPPAVGALYRRNGLTLSFALAGALARFPTLALVRTDSV